ncbi:MAG: hypothetical protein ABI693_30365 [Bryobacteraceae bacterium]
MLGLSALMPATAFGTNLTMRPYRFSTPSLSNGLSNYRACRAAGVGVWFPRAGAVVVAIAGMAALWPPRIWGGLGQWSVVLTTLGFGMVLTSVDLWSQRARAWQIAIVLLAASSSLRLAAGVELGWGAFNILAALLLLPAAPLFRVRKIPLAGGIARFAGAVAGVGIWGCLVLVSMDESRFRVLYTRWDAFGEVIRVLTWRGLTSLAPSSTVAWLLYTIQCLGIVALLYGFAVLAGPVWRLLQPVREGVVSPVSPVEPAPMRVSHRNRSAA